MNKEKIANICEELYKECLEEIPQFENGNLIWILNGSTLCNFLYNVDKIDNVFVSEEFRNAAYNFIRQPKGDIDIIYKPDRPYKFDFNSTAVINYQEISVEKRTYNFVDSNDEISDVDINQLCLMKTKNGLKFMAKKPQFLFLYKFKELLAVYHEQIISNNIERIDKKNILNDVKKLYSIAKAYCGADEISKVIELLPSISGNLHNLYENDKEKYYSLIDKSLSLVSCIDDNQKRK